MASGHSMDIGVNFDAQELLNSVDQAKREAVNRFDLKNSNIEIELSDEDVKITAPSNIQVESVYDILVKKMLGRNLSSKIFDRQDLKDIGGMRVRQEIKLIKTLDKDSAKKISKMIKENFPKAKPSIQGDSVRVSSKSIDDLQAVMAFLRASKEITVPLDFTNFK